jgi:hypothetical protein
MTRQYRNSFIVIATCAALLLVIAAVGAFARWRGNDWYAPGELAAKLQAEKNGLASTLSVPYPEFKRALFDIRQPDVVVVGSSRGLVFRQSAFTWRFSNLGGGTSSPEYGFYLLDSVFREHRPKILVYAIDHFGFMPDGSDVADRPQGVRAPQAGPRRNPILQPIHLVLSGRMATEDFLALLSPRPLKSVGVPTFGMTAAVNFRGGDGADGSAYLFGTLDTVARQSAEDRFGDDLGCVRGTSACRGAMRPFENYDPRRFAQLQRLFSELRAAGIHVVPFLAPLPPALIDDMRKSGKYGYIEKLRSDMRRALPEIHDMMDIRDLGSNDCEFYDAIHAGEVANLRVLLEIAKTDSLLSQALDQAGVRRAITQYSGSTMAVTDDVTRALAGRIDSSHKADICRGAIKSGS